MTNRFLRMLMPSVIMYSGESHYTQGMLKDNEKQKQKIIMGRSKFTYRVYFVDVVASLR